MGALFFNVLRGIILLSLPFVAVGYWPGVVLAARRVIGGTPFLSVFLFGFASFGALYALTRRHFGFFATLEHELTHLLFGLVFFKAPHQMLVTRDEGGWVRLYGHNFLIALAPYFFPTPAYFLILVGMFVQSRHTQAFMFLFGFLVAFHLVSTIRETHLQQPDLRTAGMPFAIPFLVVADGLIFASFLSFIAGGYPGFGQFWMHGMDGTVNSARHLIATVAGSAGAR